MKPPFFKTTLILCLLFISLKGYACHCALKGEFTIKEVENFDYVALVKINNTFPMDTTGGISHERPWFFTAEIQELQVFKGTSVSKLKIMMGNRKFGYSTSCDLGIDNEEEWLIFGKLNDNQIEVFSCTPTTIYKTDEGKRNWQHPDTINKLLLLDSAFNKGKSDFLEESKEKIFYPNGQIERIQTFKNGRLNGKRHGPYFSNDLRQYLSEKGEFKDGKHFGQKHHYSLGNNTGKPNSTIYYDKKGREIKYEQFDVGEKTFLKHCWKIDLKKKIQTSIYYYPSGQVKEIEISGPEKGQIVLKQYNENGDLIKNQ